MKNATGQYKILKCVHSSGNSLLYSAADILTGEPVILKTINTNTMSPKGLAKLHNEYAILLKIISDFVPKVLDFVKIDEDFFVVLKFCSGVPVSEYIKEHKITVKDFLYLAKKIVSGLSDIHNVGIIHKDINPSNIVYDPQTQKVTIIDFGISTEFSYEKPLNIDPTASEGTLYYISPEQTGRMNRTVDFRTDFYSLGVTFFEIICGCRPFESESPTELIYAHVAKLPPSAKKVNPAVPEMLSGIISKLMAKMPEDRYLSAAGILFDLNKCFAALQANNGMPEFELGTGDYSDRFEIPHKLYDREKEISSMEEAYRGILKGGKSFVLIDGNSGIGKTSLVGELYKLVVKSDGMFISGKFDQYHRNIPYYALFQAIENFCDIILSEDEQTIGIWKERIADALGQDGKLLVDKVPRIALITGQPQSLPELSPIEEGIRFKAVVQRLLTVAASPQRPLVVFIDDIHLINTGPLEIMEEIMANGDISGLLVVSCYRDNEVNDSHPLILSMNKMMGRGADIHQLSLSGLSHAAVVQMLADALYCSTDRVSELAGIIFSKTLGNPFYMKQFLILCHINGFIRFDKASRSWDWSVEAVRACPAEDNVVDFLIRNIGQLSAETINLLSLGACIGQSFSVGVLAMLSGKGPEQIAADLKQAVSIEIIYPVQSSENLKTQTVFQFSHDRFQQAFYTILPEYKRNNRHYALAEYYAESESESESGTGTDNRPKAQFLIADNYSKAFGIIDTEAEKRRVAEILFKAAGSACLLSSYDTAVRYLEQIIGSISEMQSEGDGFTFSVYTAYHSALCSLSRYEEADEVYRLIQSLANEPLDLADSCCLQAVGLSNRGKYRDAFMLGIGLLEMLGVYFPEDDLFHATIIEIDQYYAELKRDNFTGIEGKSESTDKKEFAIGKLLNRITAAGFFYDPLYSFWAIITNARRILENGFTPDGLQLYVDLTLVLTLFRNDYRLAYTAACKAKRLAEKTGYKNELFRIYHVFSLFTCHWFEDIENSIPYARESFKGNTAVGDFEFACYSYFTTQQAVLETCQSVGELITETESALAFGVKTGNRHACESYLSYKQLGNSLKGKTKAYGSFDDDSFSERDHLEGISGNQMAQCYFYILKALSAAIYSDYDTAYELTEKAAPLMPAITGFYPIVTHNFLHSLSICKRMENYDCNKEEKKRLLETLEKNQKWLGERAADVPVNFLHLYSIIDAEKAAQSNLPIESVVLYEKAISEAERSNRTYHYALICELAAQRFYKLNAPKTAINFLREAYSAYLAWGAEGKIEQLQKRYYSLNFLDYAGKKRLQFKYQCQYTFQQFSYQVSH